MGPSTVFDKSFLQNLSLDESVWFDHYFTAIITPLFFVETLADLEKTKLKEGRTAEDEVRIIADKTPEVSAAPNVHHRTLSLGELRGDPTRPSGRPVIPGGKRGTLDGKKGIVFDEAPEAEAMRRWRSGEFLEIERLFAKGWRAALATPAKLPGEDFLRWERGPLKDCTTLKHVHDLSRAIVREKRQKPYDRMKFLFDVLGHTKDLPYMARRYEQFGAPVLHEYCPYTAHLLEVEIFFRFATDRGILDRNRPSDRIDIAYLNYLPFSQIFVSYDRIHASTVPLFLTGKQEFVRGADLKADLGLINQHYAALPDSVKETGIYQFGPKPPIEGKFLTSELWDRQMSPTWRISRSLTLNPETQRKLIENMKAMATAVKASPTDESFSGDDADSMQLVRTVRKKRGSWFQVSKDFDDEAKGPTS